VGLSRAWRWLRPACVVAVVALAGCGGPGSETSRTAPQVAPAARPASVPGAGLAAPVQGDAQVMGMLAAFEQNEIDLAQQAIARQLGGDAETFARGMLRDHQRALEQVQQRSPQETEQSRALRARGQATAASVDMEDDTGQFRNAFLRAAAADYGDALKMMDAEWLPAASSDDTRAYLSGVRKRLAHGYEQAYSLVSTR